MLDFTCMESVALQTRSKSKLQNEQEWIAKYLWHYAYKSTLHIPTLTQDLDQVLRLSSWLSFATYEQNTFHFFHQRFSYYDNGPWKSIG